MIIMMRERERNEKHCLKNRHVSGEFVNSDYITSCLMSQNKIHMWNNPEILTAHTDHQYNSAATPSFDWASC